MLVKLWSILLECLINSLLCLYDLLVAYLLPWIRMVMPSLVDVPLCYIPVMLSDISKLVLLILWFTWWLACELICWLNSWFLCWCYWSPDHVHTWSNLVLLFVWCKVIMPRLWTVLLWNDVLIRTDICLVLAQPMMQKSEAISFDKNRYYWVVFKTLCDEFA